MKKLPIIAALFFFVFILSACVGNGKKIYADYHGVRYTREHDGMLGRWSYYANTENSSTGRKTLCYNADLIQECGKREIAAVAYPLAGIQSNLDPDFIEYQILSAKAAKIDGFFIEWGFMHHENDVLLKAMQKVAEKYDFEIGVNWCDGWIYYNWITQRFPEINNREKKTEYYVTCYQYLIDSVLYSTTSPVVNGKPVFYLFGPGATPQEYEWIYAQLDFPANKEKPAVLRRWADWGTLQNDWYIPITRSDDMDQWIQLNMIPTAWLPARVRARDDDHPYWDNYATQEDIIEFMKPFRDSIWNAPTSKFNLKSGFVMPGMDNRGCAGWGRGHFFYMPRASGETYKKMWEFNLESKEQLDMIFIASWSDYTEGHEIEPTIENGYTELENTLKYAAIFKEESADYSGLELPLQLFQLRRDVKFLSQTGRKTIGYDKKLDQIGSLISKAKYKSAEAKIHKISKALQKVQSDLKSETIELTWQDPALQISSTQQGKQEKTIIDLPVELKEKLKHNHYTGYLMFEYYDEGYEFFLVKSDTRKEPKNLFGTVASIKNDDSEKWKQARVQLIRDNIDIQSDRPVLQIEGTTKIKNIAVKYEIYQ